MKSIPVFYCREMSVDSGGYSPSASKPEQVVTDWQGAGLPFEIRNFGPATAADLSLVHCQDYVNGILNGEIANGHRNTNLRVSHSCLLTVGSFMAAAEEAANNGIVACSPTSGFHHACYDSCRGFALSTV